MFFCITLWYGKRQFQLSSLNALYLLKSKAYQILRGRWQYYIFIGRISFDALENEKKCVHGHDIAPKDTMNLVFFSRHWAELHKKNDYYPASAAEVYTFEHVTARARIKFSHVAVHLFHKVSQAFFQLVSLIRQYKVYENRFSWKFIEWQSTNELLTVFILWRLNCIQL